MDTDFNTVIEGIIRKKLETEGRHSEWFSLTPEKKAQYISTVNQRLTEMQQSTLSVLAAQYYEMESNPVSIDEHLQLLKQSLVVAQGRPDTEANRDYRRQLQVDIDLYSRQQTAMRSFETAWSEALTLLSPGKQANLDVHTLLNDQGAKKGLLSDRILSLQSALAAQVRTDAFTENYVDLFSKLQAFKHVERNYKTLLEAKPGADQTKALSAMTNVPEASDNAPVNTSLLLMEERPGYIRMNVALVNASYGGQYKDMFLSNGRLVLPKEGMLNFSFGTTARTLAWQEQYRVKNETGVSPTFTPIRSVLMKTEFVEKYFGSYLVSESSMRNGFNIQPLSDQTGIKLTSVDRKIPNQIGISVGDIVPPKKNAVEETLKIKPTDLEALINDYADINSFQTIALEGFRQTYYSPERDGKFVNVSDLEQSVGFADRLYLLEKPEGGDYVSATPFMSITRQKNNTLTSKLLSQAETRELYEYNLAFFEKLEALQDGRHIGSSWFNDPQQRSQFEAQLTRMLERNHMTPGGIFAPTAGQGNDQRDIKGNNLNKVLWEKDFAEAIWKNEASDALLFNLSRKLATSISATKLIDLRKNGYLDSDLAAAKQLLPALYQMLRSQAQADEQSRVTSMNSSRDPRDKRPLESISQSAIEAATSDSLIKVLLSSPPYTQISDTALQSSVAKALETTAGKSLRKQVLFHALRPIAETAAVSQRDTTYTHSTMEGNDQRDLSINNRLAQPDPYLILNAKFENMAYQEGGYVILDDKYQSYSQFVPDNNKKSTLYMRDLDTPFMGGISGTTKMVTKALSSPNIFGRALTLKEYWQFQVANSAFMIRNGYHSFFETLYVAARYEPDLAGGVGRKLLDMFDRYKVLGAGSELQGNVYAEFMALVLPIVNQGVPAAEQFNAPSFDRFGPRLQPLLSESVPYRTLQEKIQLIGEVYERLTRELRLGDEVLTPGFKQLSADELAALDLTEAKLYLKSELDNILSGQRRQGFTGPLTLDDAQRDRIAELAVEGIVRQDFGKRSELMLYLNSLGFSFTAKGNADRLLTFWSDDFQGYKSVLDRALNAQGKPGVATDYDVGALDFVHQLRNTIVSHASGGPLANAAVQGSQTVAGFLSSVYAATTADQGGAIYVMSKGGLKVNSYFWNTELPILRALQKAGVVGELRMLHEPFANYEGKQLKDIGSALTSSDVKVLANPKYLPPAFAEEMNAAEHKRWVDNGPKAILISLHRELKQYIDTHGGSGRNAAMISLLNQAHNKLLELNDMDAMTAGERITAARADLVMPGELWSTAELVKQANVFGKRQGESYLSILDLLNNWHASTKRGAFTFAGDRPSKLYLELSFKGNVIDRYTDQLQRLLPFDLLRKTWDIEVVNRSTEGLLILKNRAGASTEVRFDPATTFEQKRVQQHQLASLQRLMLTNFSADTLPATLSIQGSQISSGTRVVATMVDNTWTTDEAAINAVQRTASGPLADTPLYNQEVDNWSTVLVQANPEGSDSQYRAQVIIQSENDPVVAKAAANLAGKHPDKSLVVQLDASGEMRLVHGDPALFQSLTVNDKVRWQVVGHGRGPADARTLGGLDAEQWAIHLDRFQLALKAQYGISSAPARISLVACEVENTDLLDGFGHKLTNLLTDPNLEISARNEPVSVLTNGRKSNGTSEEVVGDKTKAGVKVVMKWTPNGVVNTNEASPAALVVGRNKVDVVALLDDLSSKRISLEDLGAEQKFTLSKLFPADDAAYDRAALKKVLDNPAVVDQLKNSLVRLVNASSSDGSLKEVDLSTLGAQALGDPRRAYTQHSELPDKGFEYVQQVSSSFQNAAGYVESRRFALQVAELQKRLKTMTQAVDINGKVFVGYKRGVGNKGETLSLIYADLESPNKAPVTITVDDLNSVKVLSKTFKALDHATKRMKPMVDQHGPVHDFNAPDFLNAGILMQALLNLSKGFGDAPDYVKAQTYMAIAQGGLELVTDVGETVAALSTLTKTGAQAGGVLAKVGGLLKTGTQALGVAANIASFGLDAKTLADAVKSGDKGMITTAGVQLGFSGVSLLVSGASFVAGLLGASTAAAVTGGLAVPLAGLGIGITALVQAFAANNAKAEQGFAFMKEINNGYANPISTVDYQGRKALLVKGGALVNRIDLRTNKVGFSNGTIGSSRSARNGHYYTKRVNDVDLLWLSSPTNAYGNQGSIGRQRSDNLDFWTVTGHQGPAEISLDEELRKPSNIIILMTTPEVDGDYLDYSRTGWNSDELIDTIQKKSGAKVVLATNDHSATNWKYTSYATTLEVVLDASDHVLVLPGRTDMEAQRLSTPGSNGHKDADFVYYDQSKVSYRLVGGGGNTVLSLPHDGTVRNTVTIESASSIESWTFHLSDGLAAGGKSLTLDAAGSFVFNGQRVHFSSYNGAAVTLIDDKVPQVRVTLDLLNGKAMLGVVLGNWSTSTDPIRAVDEAMAQMRPVNGKASDILTSLGLEQGGRILITATYERFGVSGFYDTKNGTAILMNAGKLLIYGGVQDATWRSFDIQGSAISFDASGNPVVTYDGTVTYLKPVSFIYSAKTGRFERGPIELTDVGREALERWMARNPSWTSQEMTRFVQEDLSVGLNLEGPSGLGDLEVHQITYEPSTAAQWKKSGGDVYLKLWRELQGVLDAERDGLYTLDVQLDEQLTHKLYVAGIVESDSAVLASSQNLQSFQQVLMLKYANTRGEDWIYNTLESRVSTSDYLESIKRIERLLTSLIKNASGYWVDVPRELVEAIKDFGFTVNYNFTTLGIRKSQGFGDTLGALNQPVLGQFAATKETLNLWRDQLESTGERADKWFARRYDKPEMTSVHAMEDTARSALLAHLTELSKASGASFVLDDDVNMNARLYAAIERLKIVAKAVHALPTISARDFQNFKASGGYMTPGGWRSNPWEYNTRYTAGSVVSIPGFLQNGDGDLFYRVKFDGDYKSLSANDFQGLEFLGTKATLGRGKLYELAGMEIKGQVGQVYGVPSENGMNYFLSIAPDPYFQDLPTTATDSLKWSYLGNTFNLNNDLTLKRPPEEVADLSLKPVSFNKNLARLWIQELTRPSPGGYDYLSVFDNGFEASTPEGVWYRYEKGILSIVLDDSDVSKYKISGDLKLSKLLSWQSQSKPAKVLISSNGRPLDLTDVGDVWEDTDIVVLKEFDNAKRDVILKANANARTYFQGNQYLVEGAKGNRVMFDDARGSTGPDENLSVRTAENGIATDLKEVKLVVQNRTVTLTNLGVKFTRQGNDLIVADRQNRDAARITGFFSVAGSTRPGYAEASSAGPVTLRYNLYNKWRETTPTLMELRQLVAATRNDIDISTYSDYWYAAVPECLLFVGHKRINTVDVDQVSGDLIGRANDGTSRVLMFAYRDLPAWLRRTVRLVGELIPEHITPEFEGQLSGGFNYYKGDLSPQARWEKQKRSKINVSSYAVPDDIFGDSYENIISDSDPSVQGSDYKLRGYAGNDTYLVDKAEGHIVEGVGGGHDEVRTSLASYTLDANVEMLTMTSTSNVRGIGNALDNYIDASAAGGATLDGMEGDDTLYGSTGVDTLRGGTGNDRIYGGDNMDELIGGDGNDILDGGSGADILDGGKGSDTFYIDDVSDSFKDHDQNLADMQEQDTIISSINFSLEPHPLIENLTLIKDASIGSGNWRDNKLQGNDLNNTLHGLNGNDRLDGAAGGDTLIGGSGDDTYVVDNQNDNVVEEAYAGYDSVESYIDYTLSENVEDLTLLGAASNGTGNSKDNNLTGNDAANVLKGDEGDDTLEGGKGNDTLIGGLGNDSYVFKSGSGQDIVKNDVDGTDTLIFTDAGYEDLWFTKTSDQKSLLVTRFKTGDTVEVSNFFSGQDKVNFKVTNGALQYQDTVLLVQYMSAFSAPAIGADSKMPEGFITNPTLLEFTWRKNY